MTALINLPLYWPTFPQSLSPTQEGGERTQAGIEHGVGEKVVSGFKCICPNGFLWFFVF